MQYWNSIGPILKQYWNNSLPENLSRISEKGPGSQRATKTEPYTCASTCANAFQVGGVKSQNVGCGAQRFFVDMCFQQAVPSTADPREGSLQPIVLQHPHTQRMDEYWDSTEIVLEQYWCSTGIVLEEH